MELKLTLVQNNIAPLAGLLIKGGTLRSWATNMAEFGLSPENNPLYVLPGDKANSEWGCLILLKKTDLPKQMGSFSYCQMVDDLLFIPEYTDLFPTIIPGELKKILLNTPHLLHPEIGLVKLENPLNWMDHLTVEPPQRKLISPSPDPVVIPNRVRSFRIEALSPEALMDLLDRQIGSDDELLKQRPLNLIEKAKLKLLQQFFSEDAKDENGKRPAEKLDAIRKMFGGEDDDWLDKLEKEYNELEERNKKEVERFLDLLKKDPKKGLQYAIPLDENGTGRGPMNGFGSFTLSKRWGSFALGMFGNGGGSGSLNLGDDYFRIREQYMKTAEQLIRDGDFREAAFVYLKLLKNYRLAAETLEKGGLYTEAASVYLKHLNDKLLAAKCYEKGNNFLEAIDLYKELKKYEIVGDLYRELDDEESALLYYEMVVENYLNNRQYLQAGLLVKNKLKDLIRARDLFHQGWSTGVDAYNCLNNYFNTFQEESEFRTALREIVKEENLPKRRNEILVAALELEFKKREPSVANEIRDIAYQIISKEVKRSPKLLQALVTFNPKDVELKRDLIIRKGNY